MGPSDLNSSLYMDRWTHQLPCTFQNPPAQPIFSKACSKPPSTGPPECIQAKANIMDTGDRGGSSPPQGGQYFLRSKQGRKDLGPVLESLKGHPQGVITWLCLAHHAQRCWATGSPHCVLCLFTHTDTLTVHGNLQLVPRHELPESQQVGRRSGDTQMTSAHTHIHTHTQQGSPGHATDLHQFTRKEMINKCLPNTSGQLASCPQLFCRS